MTGEAGRDGSRDLADALAERALTRTAGGLAAGGVVLGVMAALFLVLADSRLDAGSAPQVVMLSAGQVAALAVAGIALARLRSVRRQPGHGPVAAASAARLVDRLAVAVPVVGAVIGATLVVTVTPRVTSLFSVVVSLAVLAQLSVLAAVLRRGLRRAARAG